MTAACASPGRSIAEGAQVPWCRMEAAKEWPYTWEGRGGPFTILLVPGVFAPTRTSFEVAEGITINPGDTVIDVGSGSGVLST